MMRKTMIAKVVSVLLALVMVLSLAACGGQESNDAKGDAGQKTEDNAEKEKQTEEPEVVYSFEGAYASSASDAHFDWVMNLYDDGTLTVEPGLIFVDVEDYEEKATGTWSESDGVLKFNMESEDGTFTREYEIEKDENGGYLFGMDVSMATFVRPIEMRCVTEGFIPAGEAEASSFN